MRKVVVQNVVFNLIMLALIFGPAGTLAWPQGWAFLALFDGCCVALGLWMRKADPVLLRERMKSPFGTNQNPRDRAIMIAIGVVMVIWVIVLGLDARRFGWSSVPVWGQAAGALLIVLAFYGWVTVLAANTFAVTTIRVQTERGQTVISHGPYAIIRHPMYAYVIPLLIGVSLMLGSLWGLLGVFVVVPLMALRALGEEALLLRDLPGYADYAAKVRFRFVPGLW